MLISKKELFKRKNRNTLYYMYEDTVNTLASVSEQFEAKLKTIRELKNKYKNSEYIYNMLHKTEEDMLSYFYQCPSCEGQLIKSSHFVVDLKVYQFLHTYIDRLTRAVGQMDCLINTVNYIEANGLGVRVIS